MFSCFARKSCETSTCHFSHRVEFASRLKARFAFWRTVIQTRTVISNVQRVVRIRVFDCKQARRYSRLYHPRSDSIDKYEWKRLLNVMFTRPTPALEISSPRSEQALPFLLLILSWFLIFSKYLRAKGDDRIRKIYKRSNETPICQRNHKRMRCCCISRRTLFADSQAWSPWVINGARHCRHVFNDTKPELSSPWRVCVFFGGQIASEDISYHFFDTRLFRAIAESVRPFPFPLESPVLPLDFPLSSSSLLISTRFCLIPEE